MFDDLAGQAAVVTGGARGLGLAMAETLAGLGVNIALLDILPEVTEAAARLRQRSAVATGGFRVDVTDPDELREAWLAAEAVLGPVTVLVNSAGISREGDALDLPLAAWRAIQQVNLDGTFLACQIFAQRCRHHVRRGAIVNVASMSSFIVNVPQHQTAYNVSKAAVAMLTKCLAIEWLPLGIRVNAIAPGYCLSDMTKAFLAEHPDLASQWEARIPAGRMGQPGDLAGAVAFLASEASSYVVGHTLVIDGGYSVV